MYNYPVHAITLEVNLVFKVLSCRYMYHGAKETVKLYKEWVIVGCSSLQLHGSYIKQVQVCQPQRLRLN